MRVKQTVLMIATIMIIAAVLAGCGSSPSAQKSNSPEWVEELPPPDAFWGIGIARLDNESLALQTATSRARRDVAEQLKVLVQGMLVDYAREAGTLNDSTSIQFIENVGRDLVNSNISGATPNARKKMPDGTWWVRVSIRKADAQQVAADIINNEASRYAEFKAQEALKMLDQKIAEYSSTPTPRSEDE